jgi:hypothetical protein
MKRSLLTSRRVDTVCINCPLLNLSNFINLVASLRWVLGLFKLTGQPQLLIRFIRDKPMRPPVLKCANIVMVIINYCITNLEQSQNSQIISNQKMTKLIKK